MIEEKEHQFINSIRLPQAALKFCGVEIYSKNPDRSFKYLLQFFIKSFWVYSALISELYFAIEGFHKGNLFNEVSMAAPCVAISVLAIVKFSFVYINQDVVYYIVDKLKSIHPILSNNESMEIEDNVKKIEDEIVEKTMKFLKMVMMVSVYSTSLVVIVFEAKPLVFMLYDYLKTGKVELMYPFYLKFFFDPYTPARWPFVYFYQSISGMIAALYLFGADTLFYAFCTYLQMHFRLLCHRLENVVTESSVTNTRDKFRKAAKRHQELIELVALTELLYSKSTLCNILSSSLLICLSGFNITFISDIGTVFSFVTFLILSLSQIFLLCYFGDMLMTSSTQIAEAVYNCMWYNSTPDIKRNVLLVLVRAQKPCKLTAMNFADLNLSAFTTILSRSWSYFALLKTFMDD